MEARPRERLEPMAARSPRCAAVSAVLVAAGCATSAGTEILPVVPREEAPGVRASAIIATFQADAGTAPIEEQSPPLDDGVALRRLGSRMRLCVGRDTVIRSSFAGQASLAIEITIDANGHVTTASLDEKRSRTHGLAAAVVDCTVTTVRTQRWATGEPRSLTIPVIVIAPLVAP